MPKVDFTSPGLLLLALAVPPLVWWWLRQRRPALRYPVESLLPGLPSGRARVARVGGAALRGGALLLIVVALAGPRTLDLHTRIDTEGVAVFMAVDVSGSMAERDFDWHGEPVSRLEAVTMPHAVLATINPPAIFSTGSEMPKKCSTKRPKNRNVARIKNTQMPVLTAV